MQHHLALTTKRQEHKRDLAVFYTCAALTDGDSVTPFTPTADITALETIQSAAAGLFASADIHNDPRRFHVFLMIPVFQAIHSKRPVPIVITNLLPHIKMHIGTRGGHPDSDQFIYFFLP